MLYFVFVFFAGWIVAEISTGIFHWWEDRYGNEEWPIIGNQIIKPNIDHHKNPSKFCKQSYLVRNYQIIIPTMFGAFFSFYFEFWVLCWAFILMSQMNEIHSWSHQRCSYPIRLLQKTRKSSQKIF